MKYTIAERNGDQVLAWPYDSRTVDEDPYIALISRYADGDEFSVNVRASELYAFFDWLQQWCPDPRKQVVAAELPPAPACTHPENAQKTYRTSRGAAVTICEACGKTIAYSPADHS